jgi:glutamine phosphoribosylpyrophosphate amidotransferase
VFEYVYLARPDSVIDGASVYATRLKMGEYLAEKIKREGRPRDRRGHADSGFASCRDAAGAGAEVEYREGFIKNRYIGRTFIMPGQARARNRPEAERDPEFKARSCCWWTTPSCAAPPAARSCRWRATPAPRR